MDLINTLIGEGRELSCLQMSVRTIITFFVALAMLRIAGVRTFGKKTALDNVIIIMLGAVLSRAITGASPFIPTFCAALVMVLLHRLLAMMSYYNETIGKIVKGDKVMLYSKGEELKNNMKKVQISHKEILEEVRLQANQQDLDGIEEIFIERTGEISIIKK
ncbi:MAG: putative rane protein [Chitinophagaceae bacterium]|nr:putative rane protein [Chitinophagaceae bacterium]